MQNFISKLVLATAAIVAVPGTAMAAITLDSVTPGTVPYTGPTPTYDFETPAPVVGGLVTNTSVGGVSAQPLGSTGNFWTVGPTDGSPGILSLTSFGDIYNISFIWGSVDSYNLIEFLDGVGGVLASFNGNAIFNPANGNQTDPNLNPVVRFAVSGAEVSSLASLRLSSTGNAFETDNFAVNAVPEPATWAMMLLGFGAMGVSLRRRRQSHNLLQAA
jgi:hypothetical protein